MFIQSLRPKPDPDRLRLDGLAPFRGPSRCIGVADRGCAVAQDLALCIDDHPEGAPLMAEGQSPETCIRAFARLTNRGDLAALQPGACFRVRQAKGFRNYLCVDDELTPVCSTSLIPWPASNRSRRRWWRNGWRRPGAVRRIRTSLHKGSDAAPYSAQRPRHSARAAARAPL